ncbi:MAG TPA: sterol carrier family protein [Pseudonocardia sp.]|jgi:hypothetical protein
MPGTPSANQSGDPARLRAALAPLRAWLDQPDPPETDRPDRSTLATAVRLTLRAFAQAHPGKAVEVRVPPFAAVQCLPGGAHTRGTPPHVVEVEPRLWLQLVTGRVEWSEALNTTRLRASGYRAADVGAVLPLAITTEGDNSRARFE